MQIQHNEGHTHTHAARASLKVASVIKGQSASDIRSVNRVIEQHADWPPSPDQRDSSKCPQNC